MKETSSFGLIGVIKAKGILSAEVQKIVRKHCELGHLALVKMAITDGLLWHGRKRRMIPPSAGVRSDSFDVAVRESIRDLVKGYCEEGGVPLAKGYISQEEMVERVFVAWANDFPEQIPTTLDLSNSLLDEEVLARLTICAKEVRGLVMTLCKKRSGDEPSWELLDRDLEEFCVKASRRLLFAFQQPNAAAHEQAHGKPPR